MPGRTRKVAPADMPADDVLAGPLVSSEIPEAFTALRARSRSQVRRVQAATAAPKSRVPAARRATEKANGELSVTIAGKSFRLADAISLMSLMEFAAAATDVDTGNSTQLVSFFHVLQDLVHPDDWAAFKRHTRESKCSDEELVNFQNAAIEAIAARPTKGPATS